MARCVPLRRRRTADRRSCRPAGDSWRLLEGWTRAQERSVAAESSKASSGSPTRRRWNRAASGTSSACGAFSSNGPWSTASPSCLAPTSSSCPKLPDWARIARRAVGAGSHPRFGGALRRARRAQPRSLQLADISSRLARLPTPLKVVGWYFPVEVDPTWTEAPRLADALRQPAAATLDQRLRQRQCRRRDPGRLVDRLASRKPQCLLPGRCRRPRTRGAGRRALRRCPCRAVGQESPAHHRRSVPPANRRRLPRRHAGRASPPARRLWRAIRSSCSRGRIT